MAHASRLGQKFKNSDKLKDHLEQHSQYKSSISKCDQCEKKFKNVDKLKEHMVNHNKENSESEYGCRKCDKVYSNMSKLRRHDWRSHREIECNICGEMLGSREDISSHRQNEHQMSKKIICKFYPDCIDGDECFFEHEENGSKSNKNLDSEICPNGNKCDDQSCKFSEWKHLKSKQGLCKFKENCNRINCTFSHEVERKAFLGEGHSKLKKG